VDSLKALKARELREISLQSLEFLEAKSKCTTRNKKDKLNINSVMKRQNVKMTLFT
jgi:hypothetical protein